MEAVRRTKIIAPQKFEENNMPKKQLQGICTWNPFVSSKNIKITLLLCKCARSEALSCSTIATRTAPLLQIQVYLPLAMNHAALYCTYANCYVVKDLKSRRNGETVYLCDSMIFTGCFFFLEGGCILQLPLVQI